MNRAVIISVLFILVAMLSTMGIMNTYHMKTQMKEYLMAAEQAAIQGDIEKAVKESENIQKKWDEKEKWLLLYVKHNEIDTINQSISELKFLIQYQDTAEFCSKINETITMIEHVWESELQIYKHILYNDGFPAKFFSLFPENSYEYFIFVYCYSQQNTL